MTAGWAPEYRFATRSLPRSTASVYWIRSLVPIEKNETSRAKTANLYSGAHPAVIQLIKAVIRTSKRFGIDTSLCGEIAGEAIYTMLLIGLGLRILSLVQSQIPPIKRVIRSVDVPTCERLARKVGSFDSERQVLKCLRDELERVLPEMEDGWSAS